MISLFFVMNKPFLPSSSNKSSLNDLELQQFNVKDVIALLVSQSESASLSLELLENKSKVTKIAFSSICYCLLTDQTRSFKKESICSEPAALTFKQRTDLSHYLLDTESLSYIVLVLIDENECYVNLLHCQIISDSDGDLVVLYNTFRFIFTAQNLVMTESI